VFGANLNTVAFIPARGGSKGLPGKNLAHVGGMSLVARAITLARGISEIAEVIVSSDDPAILREARRYDAVCDHRPSELARDESSTREVVLEYLERRPDIDRLVLLQPTSPLRDESDVRRCLAALASADSVATVTPCEHPPEWTFRMDEQGGLRPLLGWGGVRRRQDARPTFRLNGAVYAIECDVLRHGGDLVSEGTFAVVMPPERSVDIDVELDLWIARLLLERPPRCSPRVAAQNGEG
jgi:CMP-N,N'-diacetyllegionaminic acid synthase